ncbi:hypothetical protein CALCODRAFT_501823, partial [Calocera cornea HHB12733]
TPVPTPHAVPALLSFLSPALKAKPYTKSTSGETNVISEERTVPVTDLRSLPESDLQAFTTDTSGFQWVKHESKLSGDELLDEESIKRVYYPEVDAFLKSRLGAKRTFIFDHTTRRAPPRGEKVDFGRDPNARGPVHRAHVDQSRSAGAERVFVHMGEEAERLSRGRVQIVNVWRPIRGPVTDWPLAVADYRSVDPETDLQPTDLIYPHRVGETLSVRYSPRQRWYYISEQQPEDVLLLKCYESESESESDSLSDTPGADGVQKGRALLTPHTAFWNPESGGREGEPRQSIEVRALVFYSD